MNSDDALIMMINPQTRQTIKTVFKKSIDPNYRQYQFVHINICGWVIQNNQSFVTENIHKDVRFRKNLFKNIPLKSVICTPLRAEGVIIGTLLLFNKSNGAVFSHDDLFFLEQFAAIVSPYLRNVQKIQEFFMPCLTEETLLNKYQKFGLIGKSEKFVDLLQAIESASRCDVRIF